MNIRDQAQKGYASILKRITGITGDTQVDLSTRS